MEIDIGEIGFKIVNMVEAVINSRMATTIVGTGKIM
jgi:hypothetical protein